MRGIWQDVRFTWRIVRTHPGAMAIAVLSLALGIGATAVVFSLVDGLFLRPLPIADPSGLVQVEWKSFDGRTSAVSWRVVEALQDADGAFADVAAQNNRGGLLDVGGDVELTLLTIVSDNYFPLLGVRAQLGRLFRRDLDEALTAEPAIVITDGLWRRRFGADPALVGRTIRLNGRSLTVVGILPAGFRGLRRVATTDLWVPVSTWRAMGNAAEFEERVTGQFEPLARFRPGASIGAAQAQLDTLARSFRDDDPEASRGRRLTARPHGDEEGSGRTRVLSALLLSIAGLLVVIACANVAQLLLAVSEARRREIAIRQALGASRGRLFRQLLTEGAFLAAIGAGVALVVAAWLIPVLPALLPAGPAFVQYDFRLDWRVVTATCATGILAVLLFALIPALRGSRADLTDAVKSGGWGGSTRFGGRRWLVASQAMLGVTLLSAAGLLGLSFARAQQTRPGFASDRSSLIIEASVDGPRERLPFLSDAVIERIAALPGIKQAAYGRRFPMSSSGGGATLGVVIPGREVPAGQQLLRVRYNQVSPDYFTVAGTALVTGRAFSRADSATSTRVAIVNETMARQYWPGGNAVGAWFTANGHDVQIVGIAENAVVNSLHEAAQPFMYFPFAQWPVSDVTFLVEGAVEPAGLVPGIRREMRAAAPDHVVLLTTTMRDHMRDALYQDWLQAVIAVSLAVVGIFLAVVGLAGVVMHSVTRRLREFGVRTALGASRTDVVIMVLKEGATLSGAGAIVGVGTSLAVGRALSGLLFGISPNQPAVVGASVATVVLLGILASVYPAWKATRVDPAATLRAD